MTQHDIAARAPNYVAFLLSLIGLVSLLYIVTHAPTDDATDKARAHVEQQAKAQMERE